MLILLVACCCSVFFDALFDLSINYLVRLEKTIEQHIEYNKSNKYSNQAFEQQIGSKFVSLFAARDPVASFAVPRGVDGLARLSLARPPDLKTHETIKKVAVYENMIGLRLSDSESKSGRRLRPCGLLNLESYVS